MILSLPVGEQKACPSCLRPRASLIKARGQILIDPIYKAQAGTFSNSSLPLIQSKLTKTFLLSEILPHFKSWQNAFRLYPFPNTLLSPTTWQPWEAWSRNRDFRPRHSNRLLSWVKCRTWLHLQELGSSPDRANPLPLIDLAGIFATEITKLGAISWRY